MLHSTSMEVKTALSGVSRSSLALKQVFTDPPRRLKRRFRSFPHINRLAPTSRFFESGQNCFLDLLWHLNRPPRTSQHFLGGENGVIRSFQHINRLAPNSQVLHRGENGVIMSSPHINSLAPTSQCFQSGENCFPDFLWHLNRPPRASQNLLGG